MDTYDDNDGDLVEQLQRAVKTSYDNGKTDGRAELLEELDMLDRAFGPPATLPPDAEWPLKGYPPFSLLVVTTIVWFIDRSDATWWAMMGTIMWLEAAILYRLGQVLLPYAVRWHMRRNGG